MHVLKSKKEQITLKFGKQTLNGAPYNHKGLDMVKNPYSLDYIIACQTGKVIGIETKIPGKKDGSYGNYVMLEHANGIRTLYAHMKYGTVKVKKGQVVKQGEVLGYMGNTGNSFGAHLHFEVRVNNKQVDPLPYIQDKKNIGAYGTITKTETKTNTSVFTKNKDYTTQVILKVRKGAGTNYAVVPYEKLTANAKKYSYASGSNKGCLKKGTVITCLDVKKVKNDIWVKIPSGWIAGFYNNQKYLK